MNEPMVALRWRWQRQTYWSVGALVAAVLMVGCINVVHYVGWQNEPRTRQASDPYVTTREFSGWSAAILDRARNKEGIMTVGQWCAAHPLEDLADPYGVSP